jgi:hypothetical protein
VDFDSRMAEFIRSILHHHHRIQPPIKKSKILGGYPRICPTPGGKNQVAQMLKR